MGNINTREYWDEVYKKELQKGGGSTRNLEYRTNAALNYVSRLIKERQMPVVVLEVGCGTGELSKKLFDAGAYVVGIDISEVAIAYAIKNNAGPDYYQADIFTMRPKFRGFDVVIANEFIEHWEDVYLTFDTLFSAVKSKGTLFFSVPHRAGKTAHWKEHYYYFDTEVLYQHMIRQCEEMTFLRHDDVANTIMGYGVKK